jgi:hypothetical protein
MTALYSDGVPVTRALPDGTRPLSVHWPARGFLGLAGLQIPGWGRRFQSEADLGFD